MIVAGVFWPAGDEADDIATLVADGKYEPVAEPVDQPPVAGAGGQPGVEEFLGAGAAFAELV